MFKGKRVLVFGAGVSGIGAAKTLLKEDAEVAIYDQKKINFKKEDTAYFTSGNVQIFEDTLPADVCECFDFAVLSPGISINNPLVQSVIDKGMKVIGEVELAYLLYNGKIVGITGTNGKTTTTTLVAEMLKRLTVPSATGGNIGHSLSWLAANLGDDSFLTAEVSSFQLESIESFKPRIAAILNITPDHIDRHGDMQGYIAAKMQIFKNQDEQDYLLLNYDDEIVRGFAEKTKAQVCFFSNKKQLEEGAYVKDGSIFFCYQGKETEIVKISDMKIFGAHNVENALAACACAYFAGVSFYDICEVLKDFEGVEHRIEYTRTVNGVKYYNDSKATNPESTIKALEAFSGHILLLAGGYDKMTDLTELMQLAKKKTDALILLGKAKERFVTEAQRNGVTNVITAESFEEALGKAHELAREPQVVLLSPACASYDMFNNFEERGRYFKELVGKL